MRVLLVHNFYGSEAPSGEATVFNAEKALLTRRGVTVAQYTRSSDQIRQQGLWGKIQGGMASIWNPASARALRKCVRHSNPDVVHVHNTFPLISPSIYWALRKLECAVVLTLHNYRSLCAAATLERGGEPCTLCIEKSSVLPALRFGCYRGSRAATAPLAASISLHKRLHTLASCVDGFIALTPFQKSMHVRGGLPESRIFIKPQFYEDPPRPRPWASRTGHFGFVGRLSHEKGPDLLLEAWRRLGADAPKLTMLGDGPLRPALVEFVRKHGLEDRVHIAGGKPFEEAQEILASLRLLIVPSRYFEGFPMVIREAYAYGVPVLAADLGSLHDLVTPGETGDVFTPNDPASLQQKIRELGSDPARLESLSRGARSMFDRELTADVNFEQLMGIYAASIDHRRSRGT